MSICTFSNPDSIWKKSGISDYFLVSVILIGPYFLKWDFIGLLLRCFAYHGSRDKASVTVRGRTVKWSVTGSSRWLLPDLGSQWEQGETGFHHLIVRGKDESMVKQCRNFPRISAACPQCQRRLSLKARSPLFRPAGRLVASLVAEFLQFFHLDFTLAVFQPEASTVRTISPHLWSLGQRWAHEQLKVNIWQL